MKIPIIILNYNSSADCKKCVSSLKNQTGVEIEVIIVDNCSRGDDLADLRVLCRDENYKLIENKENRGYNAGNNIGLKYAAKKGYEYALIANPDMEFPKTDYIEKLVTKMESDQEIVVCGSDIITPDGKHQNPLRELTFYEELFWLYTYIKNRKSKKYYTLDYTKSSFCEKVSGCCFLIKMSFLKNISFLDENVFLYSEEPILSKQVVLSNKKMYYLADTMALHAHIKSAKGDSFSRLNEFFKSRNYYLKNYSNYNSFKLKLLLFSRKIEKKFYKLYYILK